MRWRNKVLPSVAVISLLANLYFLLGVWKDATHTNHYLWGNMTNHVIAGVTWAENGMDPDARFARATLDLMRSLPRYSRRVGPDDFRTIEDFLRKASHVQVKALQERSQSGTYSEETARQMAKIEQGFALLLDHLHRVNDLEEDSYAFNDSAWRAMWGEIAQGLNQVHLH